MTDKEKDKQTDKQTDIKHTIKQTDNQTDKPCIFKNLESYRFQFVKKIRKMYLLLKFVTLVLK